MTTEVSQNPGDLLLPKDWVAIPRKRVLVISINKAKLVPRGKFDEIVALSGTDFSDEEQEEALRDTTV